MAIDTAKEDAAIKTLVANSYGSLTEDQARHAIYLVRETIPGLKNVTLDADGASTTWEWGKDPLNSAWITHEATAKDKVVPTGKRLLPNGDIVDESVTLTTPTGTTPTSTPSPAPDDPAGGGTKAVENKKPSVFDVFDPYYRGFKNMFAQMAVAMWDTLRSWPMQIVYRALMETVAIPYSAAWGLVQYGLGCVLYPFGKWGKDMRDRGRDLSGDLPLVFKIAVYPFLAVVGFPGISNIIKSLSGGRLDPAAALNTLVEAARDDFKNSTLAKVQNFFALNILTSLEINASLFVVNVLRLRGISALTNLTDMILCLNPGPEREEGIINWLVDIVIDPLAHFPLISTLAGTNVTSKGVRKGIDQMCMAIFDTNDVNEIGAMFFPYWMMDTWQRPNWPSNWVKAAGGLRFNRLDAVDDVAMNVGGAVSRTGYRAFTGAWGATGAIIAGLGWLLGSAWSRMTGSTPPGPTDLARDHRGHRDAVGDARSHGREHRGRTGPLLDEIRRRGADDPAERARRVEGLAGARRDAERAELERATREESARLARDAETERLAAEATARAGVRGRVGGRIDAVRRAATPANVRAAAIERLYHNPPDPLNMSQRAGSPTGPRHLAGSLFPMHYPRGARVFDRAGVEEAPTGPRARIGG